MIRIDHITDPFRFLLAMALCSAVGTPPSPFVAMISLVPAVAERMLGTNPLPEGPRPMRAGRPPRAAGPQPSPA